MSAVLARIDVIRSTAATPPFSVPSLAAASGVLNNASATAQDTLAAAGGAPTTSSSSSPSSAPGTSASSIVSGKAQVSAQSTDTALPDWAASLPTNAQRWVPTIVSESKAAGIDPRLTAAVMWSESGFRPDARSGAGAIGLMQLMPSTAAALGADPSVPEQNIHAGVKYLASNLRRFGSVELAAAAYNAGGGAVARYHGIPPYAETQNYVKVVMGKYHTLGGGA